MKKINFKSFFIGLITSILIPSSMMFISHGSSSTLIGVIIIIFGINISTIFLYKSLNIKNIFYKHIFSVLNQILGIGLGFIIFKNLVFLFIN